MKATILLSARPGASVSDLRRSWDSALDMLLIQRNFVAPCEGGCSGEDISITWLMDECDLAKEPRDG